MQVRSKGAAAEKPSAGRVAKRSGSTAGLTVSHVCLCHLLSLLLWLLFLVSPGGCSIIFALVRLLHVQAPVDSRSGKRQAVELAVASATTQHANQLLDLFTSDNELEKGCAELAEAEREQDELAEIERDAGSEVGGADDDSSPDTANAGAGVDAPAAVEGSGKGASSSAEKKGTDPDPGDHKMRLVNLLIAARDKNGYTDAQRKEDVYAHAAHHHKLSFKRGDPIGMKLMAPALTALSDVYTKLDDASAIHTWTSVESAVTYIRNAKELVMVCHATRIASLLLCGMVRGRVCVMSCSAF